MKERGVFWLLGLTFLGIWGLTFSLNSWDKINAARQQLVERIPRVEKKILNLGELLAAQRLSNGRTLKRYADRLEVKHPESAELINALSMEATRDGRLYQGVAGPDARAAPVYSRRWRKIRGIYRAFN